MRKKRFLLFIVSIVSLLFVLARASAQEGNNNDDHKVIVCQNGKEIEVDKHAAPPHDIGPCNSEPPPSTSNPGTPGTGNPSPPVTNPPVNNPPTDNPPVSNPPVNNPGTPGTPNPPVSNPPVTTPSDGNPPTSNPPGTSTDSPGTSDSNSNTTDSTSPTSDILSKENVSALYSAAPDEKLILNFGSQPVSYGVISPSAISSVQCVSGQCSVTASELGTVRAWFEFSGAARQEIDVVFAPIDSGMVYLIPDKPQSVRDQTHSIHLYPDSAISGSLKSSIDGSESVKNISLLQGEMLTLGNINVTSKTVSGPHKVTAAISSLTRTLASAEENLWVNYNRSEPAIASARVDRTFGGDQIFNLRLGITITTMIAQGLKMEKVVLAYGTKCLIVLNPRLQALATETSVLLGSPITGKGYNLSLPGGFFLHVVLVGRMPNGQRLRFTAPNGLYVSERTNLWQAMN